MIVNHIVSSYTEVFPCHIEDDNVSAMNFDMCLDNFTSDAVE